MVVERPFLREQDIVAELVTIHRAPRRALDTALYGRGDEGTVSAETAAGVRQWRVVPVRSELQLRRALSREHALPLLALVDYDADRLPADLAGRLARGAVKGVSAEARIRRRFNVGWVHPDVQRLRVLCDALLRDADALSLPAGLAQLDLDAAWRALLARNAALPADGPMTLPRLLLHAATVAPSAQWATLLGELPALREPFDAWLASTVDPAAPRLWRAWEQGSGPSVAALTFVLAPIAPRFASSSYLLLRARTWVDRASRAIAGDADVAVASLERWGEAEAWLARRLKADHPRTLDLLLRLADELLAPDAGERELRDAAEHSTHLGLAWTLAQESLASALGRCLPKPDAAQFAEALAGFERLRLHRRAEPEAALVNRARMALRLVGWIAAGVDLAWARTDGASWAPAIELAQDYAAQGGFADHCRQGLRGSGDGVLAAALAAVQSEVDRLRDDQDRTFAASLRAWVGAGRRSEQAVPIERALDVFAAPFLKEHAHRKLLVVLLDGMAWANAVELCLDLESRGYGLLRWRPRVENRFGGVAPVLTALPTTTEVSRAAFFAGAVPEAGDSLDTTRDPRRFAEHRGLRAVVEASPKLLIRPHVEAPSGHASDAALRLVRSDDRVVAVVVNAVDDQLHGSRQVLVRYGVESIKPLGDLLRAAEESGRAVLLASDHGHVPVTRLQTLGRLPDGGGARWRVLGDAESPGAGEAVFQGAGVWTPRAKGNLALRVGETDAWGTVSGSGQHGGVSLAEVVAPAILVVSDALARDTLAATQDLALQAQPFPRPRWWDLEWPTSVATPRRPAAPPAVAAQPSLPAIDLGPPRALTPPKASPAKPMTPTAPASREARLILASGAYESLTPERRQYLRTNVAALVDALMAHGGTLALDALERALSLLPGRGPGAVAMASELLNLEGYPVLTDDPGTKLVRLDVSLLDGLHDAGGGR